MTKAHDAAEAKADAAAEKKADAAEKKAHAGDAALGDWVLFHNNQKWQPPDYVEAALVCSVDADTGTVNLCVFGHDGVPRKVHNVPVVAAGDTPEVGYYCFKGAVPVAETHAKKSHK